MSTKEMAEAIRQANWPPISEFDICLIDMNPNFNKVSEMEIEEATSKKFKGGVKRWKKI